MAALAKQRKRFPYVVPNAESNQTVPSHPGKFPKPIDERLRIKFCGRIIHVRKRDQVAPAVQLLQLDHPDNTVLGFDMEWRPENISANERNNVALIQLCTASVCLLFHMLELSTMPLSLREVLEANDIQKVCHGFEASDRMRLVHQFGVNPRSFIDTAEMARKLGNWQCGLKALVNEHFFPLYLDKTLATSDWAAEWLTPEQIVYAATDAWITRELYMKLTSLPQTCSITPVAVGDTVYFPATFVPSGFSRSIRRKATTKPQTKDVTPASPATYTCTSNPPVCKAPIGPCEFNSKSNSSQRKKKCDVLPSTRTPPSVTSPCKPPIQQPFKTKPITTIVPPVRTPITKSLIAGHVPLTSPISDSLVVKQHSPPSVAQISVSSELSPSSLLQCNILPSQPDEPEDDRLGTVDACPLDALETTTSSSNSVATSSSSQGEDNWVSDSSSSNDAASEIGDIITTASIQNDNDIVSLTPATHESTSLCMSPPSCPSVASSSPSLSPKFAPLSSVSRPTPRPSKHKGSRFKQQQHTNSATTRSTNLSSSAKHNSSNISNTIVPIVPISPPPVTHPATSPAPPPPVKIRPAKHRPQRFLVVGWVPAVFIVLYTALVCYCFFGADNI